MTPTERTLVAKTIRYYHEMANNPSETNDIYIQDGKCFVLKNGNIVKETPITSSQIKADVQSAVYTNNPFNSTDIQYSPLEADRNELKYIWKKSYEHINFPRFIPIIAFSLAIHGKVPNFIDFAQIYIESYIEIVPDKYFESSRKLRMNKMSAEYNDRIKLGQMLSYPNISDFKNRELRFNFIGRIHVSGLPCGKYTTFTTEQLLCRLFKVYGSCIRDIYTMLRIHEIDDTVDTYYGLYLDIKQHTDGFIDNIPYYGYSCTKASKDFRYIKINYRQINAIKSDVGLALIKSREDNNGVKFISDEQIKNIIKSKLPELKKPETTGIFKFYC